MTLRLKIGPYVIALVSTVPPEEKGNGSYSPFFYQGEDASNLFIRVREGLPVPLARPALAGELPKHWRLFKEGEGWRFELLDPLHFKTKQAAKISSDFRSADFYFCGEQGVLFSTRPWPLSQMTPFLQWWLTAYGAMRKIGFFIHASASAFPGKGGIVFAGPSGAGKTTLAMLCREHGGAVLLNDERSMLWRDESGFRVSGTPWPGKSQEVSPLSAPLATLFLIKKAEQNRFVPVSKKGILDRLIPELFLPSWNREAMSGLFEFCDRLIQKVPVMELHFRQNAGAVEMVKKIMAFQGDTQRLEAA
ncbi:MAG: hypothetical protein HY466_01705 [Deltaproteobacteria bacterium]|nr:hypothetical protein [Deltaproteobacteria bacterium]